MFALHSIAIIFHQKPEATTSTAKGGGSTFNGIYSPPPPPPRRKSFQIKVTASIFKLVKVPAILNAKFRFEGSMVGEGGGGVGAAGGSRSP